MTTGAASEAPKDGKANPLTAAGRGRTASGFAEIASPVKGVDEGASIESFPNITGLALD
jgi:hypothetical protein